MATSSEARAGIQTEIQQAIAAHGMWKVRMKQALRSGTIDQEPAAVRLDNQCAFGKWLHACPPAVKQTPFHGAVLRLHAEFHQVSSEVYAHLKAGRRADAEAMLAPEGQWTLASVNLTSKMVEWQRSL